MFAYFPPVFPPCQRKDKERKKERKKVSIHLQLDEIEDKKIYKHPDDYDWDGDLDAPDCFSLLVEVSVDAVLILSIFNEPV